MAETETDELYKKHRPRTLGDIAGQKDAIKILTDLGKRGVMPHALLFCGPSGCGKTTLARIVAKKLKCSAYDFAEINAGSCRGIDGIRDIESRMGVSPLGGDCRVWLIDEAHALTGDAQTSLLKMLEDTPKHVYFMLATTDPGKLKKTIVTRCTQITCKALTESEIQQDIQRVCQAEGRTIDGAVVAKIAETAGGSARQAMVTLHAVIGLSDTASQLAAIENADVTAQGIDLARLLLKEKASWKEVATILKTVEEDAETVRRIVVGYSKALLLNAGSARAHLIIEELREPLFDAGTAMSLLASSCYAIVNG